MHQQSWQNIQAYKDGLVEFMESYDFNLHVTLSMNETSTLAGAKKKLREFDKRVNRKMLGSDWYKKPNADRFFYFAAAEHLDGDPHWHLLARANNPKIANVAFQLIWKAIVPSGSCYVKDVDEADDPEFYRRNLRGYILKEIERHEDYESFVVPYSFSKHTGVT